MDFRGQFKSEAPFIFDVSDDDAYRRIDESRKKCESLIFSLLVSLCNF